MYTSIEEAKKEVWKRWNDADLRRRVQAYVGEVPEGFGHEPRAVALFHLGTPNNEFCAFTEKAVQTGLKLLCAEYTGDKFCSMNPDKLHLGKLIFFHGKGKNNGDKISSHHAIEFCAMDGKLIQNVTTLWGESFVNFHHRMLASSLPPLELIEMTAWYQNIGGSAEHFYQYLMALFICHGILFESFLEENDEGKFTREIVWPALQKVTDHFGVKPLIVRLLPEESEADPYWCWYPGHLEDEVKFLIAGVKTAASLHAQHEGADRV